MGHFTLDLLHPIDSVTVFSSGSVIEIYLVAAAVIEKTVKQV